jgi:hypothetical protein
MVLFLLEEAGSINSTMQNMIKKSLPAGYLPALTLSINDNKHTHQTERHGASRR